MQKIEQARHVETLSPFEDVEQHLQEGDMEVALATVMEWTHDPGMHIASQLEELAVLYKQQITDDRLYLQGDIIDFTRFTTQHTGEGQASEVYWLIDNRSPQIEDYHERSYAIDLHSNEGRTRIEVAASGDTTIYQEEGRRQRPVLESSAKEQIMFDVFCSLLIAREQAESLQHETGNTADFETDNSIEEVKVVDLAARGLRKYGHDHVQAA